MKYLKYIVVLNISVLFAGCSVGMLNVQSTPEGADVYISHEGQQPVKIGKTPVNISSQQVNSQPGSNIQLKIQKEGFGTESFMIPKSAFNSSISVSTQLNEVKLPLACTQGGEVVDKVARSVAHAQNSIHQKKYDQALQILNNLLLDNPNSSVIYDLVGNAHYMSKNLNDALEAYESSLRLNPQSLETKRMVFKLRTITNVRSPASEGGY